MTKLAKEDKRFHIGIDVAKDKLDIHCLETREDWQIENNKKGIAAFARKHHEILLESYVTIDTTGGHEHLCCEALHNRGYAVHQAHSYRVKHFIRSMGQEAKTDRLDATMLALYGRERKENLRLYAPASKNQQDLKRLVLRREELVKMQTQEKNRQAGPMARELKTSFEAVLNALKKEIKKIEMKIRACIKRDEMMEEKEAVLLTIKGIGEKTSYSLLALLPELGELDRKQVAALAGLAPYAKDSGKYTGYRSIKAGRPALRRALFMAALSAVRYNEELKVFYTRLRNNGKKPIVALTATARKLATIANARIRDMQLS
jgi:transposase